MKINNNILKIILVFLIILVIGFIIILNKKNLENFNEIVNFKQPPGNHPKKENLYRWREILPCCVTNITHDSDYIYGRGTDGQVYRTLLNGGTWTLLFGNDGTYINPGKIMVYRGFLYGLARNKKLHRRNLNGQGEWEFIEDPEQKDLQWQDFYVHNDIVYTIGMDQQLYSRRIRDNEPYKVFAPCCITYITIENDTIYGIGTDNAVWTYPVSAGNAIINKPICRIDGNNGNWTRCAGENGVCNVQGTADVIYRRTDGREPERNAIIRGVTGSINCNNSEFGDPARGHNKSCFYRGSIAAFCGDDLINTFVPAKNERCPQPPGWCTHDGCVNTQKICGDLYGNWAKDKNGNSGFNSCGSEPAPSGSQWPNGTCPEANFNNDSISDILRQCNEKANKGIFGICSPKFSGTWERFDDTPSRFSKLIFQNNDLYGLGKRSKLPWKFDNASKTWKQQVYIGEIIDFFILNGMYYAVSTDNKVLTHPLEDNEAEGFQNYISLNNKITPLSLHNKL